MKILLVYTNRFRSLASPAAGIAYLIEPLRRKGHAVEVLDLMFSGNPIDELNGSMDAFQPDIVGFSVRNIDNQDMGHPISFLPEVREYVAAARRKKMTIILGGTAFTIFPRETLSYTGADYGIAGQGERSLPLLIESLEEGRIDEAIPGLVWRDHGMVRVNPPDFSGYAEAHATWDLMDLSGYSGGILPGGVVTKSGCPYTCAYCNVASSFGGRFTFRDTADIVEEIRDLKGRHGISSIALIDPCFNVPVDYAKDVLRAIAGAGLNVKLFTSIVPVKGHYDDELFELYNRAGGGILSLGVETFSEKMLKSYNKPFTLEDMRASTGLMRKHKIPYLVHALFGGPGEDADTIRESMEVLPELRCSMFFYNIGIRIMPGTVLFDVAKKEGLVKEASELFTPKFYVSKDLDIAWADQYIKSKIEECGL